MEPTPTIEAPVDPAWRRLLHRWLVEYNPLYLVSAALVMVGVVMLSGGLAGTGGPLGQIGITAIAELYAWALIGGAAVLVRVGLRRPAVMLALLAVFYQCDPTLHTETSVHLGQYGMLASSAWFVLFFAKLRFCAWALRLFVSRSATAVALLGAAGVALVPWLLYAFSPRVVTALVGAWVFAVFAAGLWSTRAIHSVTPLGEWALTVARRSLRGIWLGWAGMLLVHVLFWNSEHGRVLDVGVLVPVGLLLSTRWLPRERTVWSFVAATLAAVAFVRPELLAVTAVMAAAVLTLRAFRRPVAVEQLVERAAYLGPYRSEAGDGEVPALHRELAFVTSERPALVRLCAGALGCLYLAAWTQGWVGGAWPRHAWWLDAALAVATSIWVLRRRDRLPLVLPAVAAAHWIVQARIVPAPANVVQWGAACVGTGFALLLLALTISVRLRRLS